MAFTLGGDTKVPPKIALVFSIDILSIIPILILAFITWFKDIYNFIFKD